MPLSTWELRELEVEAELLEVLPELLCTEGDELLLETLAELLEELPELLELEEAEELRAEEEELLDEEDLF